MRNDCIATPEPAAFTAARRLVCWLGLAVVLLSLNGCGPKAEFEPLRMAGPPDNYCSFMWTLRSTVHMAKLPSGLRCEVVADPEPTRTPYGGVALPGKGASAFRLEMSCPLPDAIATLYVDAYDAENRRVARWETEGRGMLPVDGLSYLFRPGKSPPGFKFVSSKNSAPIATIHVFVRVEPGGRAVFEISRVELKK